MSSNNGMMPHEHPVPGEVPATQRARLLAGQWAQQAAQTVSSWTVKKYTLPDKNVASQVLMYRQLLHCKCRPGLKLSRDYQGTPAQVAVKHMPWWCRDIDETHKMVISYDNLITRLWIHGAIMPWEGDDDSDETLLDSVTGMPPVPHEYWVDRLGFQQQDPVTDFRSGGVLSLAMMVHIVESCPAVHSRFVRPAGDASVLPFGITSINVTDMMATFLMLAKSIDRMDALMSQKPFWRMFADPNAILACQELCMALLADVVVELRTERTLLLELKNNNNNSNNSNTGTTSAPSSPSSPSQTATAAAAPNKDVVTVFDFAYILEVTRQRVHHDLLGAGPGSVQELRAVHAKLIPKYQAQLQSKLQRLRQTHGSATNGSGGSSPQQQQQGSGDTDHNTQSLTDVSVNGTSATTTATPTDPISSPPASSTGVALFQRASGLAGNVFSKITKSPGFSPLRSNNNSSTAATTSSTTTVLPTTSTAPIPTAATTPTTPSATTEPEPTMVSLPPLAPEEDAVLVDMFADTSIAPSTPKQQQQQPQSPLL